MQNQKNQWGQNQWGQTRLIAQRSIESDPIDFQRSIESDPIDFESDPIDFILMLLKNGEAKPHPELDWDHFFKLVIKHRLWYRFQKCSILPLSQLQQLTSLCQRDIKNLIKIAVEHLRIAKKFSEKGIQHCFVKGIVLNYTLYGALNTRPCRDIDVWVGLDDFEQAMQLLIELGYQQKLPNYPLTGFKKKYHFKHRHDVAFYHPERQTLIELHFKLSYLGVEYFSFDQVECMTISIMNQPIQTLQDDYHLLYLMLHGAIHGWCRLRWLEDIFLFLQSNRCDLSRVFQLAQQINCQFIVEQSLLLVQTFFPYEPPSFKAHAKSIALKKRASEFIYSDYEMTEQLKNPLMFLKHRFYLFKVAVRGKKFQSLREDLFKIDELFPVYTLAEPLVFMYYFLYPLWILKMILNGKNPSQSLLSGVTIQKH